MQDRSLAEVQQRMKRIRAWEPLALVSAGAEVGEECAPVQGGHHGSLHRVGKDCYL